MRTPGPEHSPVVLDLAAGRLVVGGRPVELRPKTWEVLLALAGSAGDLVTKEELLDRVWAGTAVTESTLSKSIGELRLALGDRTDAPRFLETVPRRGFRWIGAAQWVRGTEAPDGPGDASAAQEQAQEPPPAPSVARRIVARGDQLARLESAFERARGGRRQVVFVTGEAGAGKTMLVDSFLERLANSPRGRDARIAHGLCVETSGPHEPYFPFLDALERLARDGRDGEAVAAILRRTAPTWVDRLPALASSGPANASPLVPGSMLREFASAIDEIARDRPLVLVLEDAHWSDLASTDAFAAIATRRDPARLLLLVTKRSAEAVVLDHPIVDLRRNLVARGAAEEIVLVPFGRAAVGEYLALRCPGLDEHPGIGDWLQQQTAGNPLFVRLVVDEWITQGLVSPSADERWAAAATADELRRTVPGNLRALLERQVAQLAPAERTVLEAASVRIGEFRTDAIAAATAMQLEDVEAACAGIARRGQLLRACGPVVTRPGSVAEQYAFLHATVQNVVADGLPRSRWRRLNLAAAGHLEAEYAGRLREVSSLLAVHYEEAGDQARAIEHLRESARHAMHHDAPRDAVVALERAMALVDASPQLPDAARERLLTLSDLSHARQLGFGFGDPEVARLWSRVGELAGSTEDLRNAVIAHSGGLVAACVAGRYADAHDTIRTVLPLAEHLEDAGARKLLAFAVGNILYRTSSSDSAATVFETAIATPHENDPVPGADLNALLMSQYAPAAALRGRPDDVRRLVRGSLERAREHSHYSECVTGSLAAWSLGLMHDFAAAAPIARHTIEVADTYGFLDWTSRPLFLVGMSQIRDGQVDEGHETVGRCIEGRKRTGHWVDQSAMCCLYAEALMDAGRDGGDELLEQARRFVADFGEFFFESEILRLTAKSNRLQGLRDADSEPLLGRALELALARGNHWHALLAASDLAERLHADGRSGEATALLQPACGAIRGGADLAAVRGARDLLERASNAG